MSLGQKFAHPFPDLLCCLPTFGVFDADSNDLDNGSNGRIFWAYLCLIELQLRRLSQQVLDYANEGGKLV